MKNLKVGVKLIVSFLVVAILAGVIGLIGIINLKNIDHADEMLFNRNTLGTLMAGQAATLFQRIRVNVFRTFVVDESEREQTISNLQELTQEMQKTAQAYSELDISDEHRQMLDNSLIYWTSYKEHLIEWFEFIERGDIEAAKNYNEQGMSENGDEMRDALDQLILFNAERAEERAIENKATSNTATILMIIVIALGIVIAVVLGLIMTRSITRPVNITEAQLQKMAAGEEMDELDADNYSGEFRNMAISFNAARESLNLLREDVNSLAQAGVRGQLSTRADLNRHRGGYRQIVSGVNDTLDAVVAPINEAADALSKIAQGDLSASITSDFVGDYAIIKEALNSTAAALQGYIAEIAMILGEMADGNLNIEITSEYRGDFVALKDSINGIIGSLNNVMSEIGIAAEQVTTGTGQVSQGSQEIAQGAAEQASSIEELTAAITQIAEQTKQNAGGANTANQLTNEAAEEAARGDEQMNAMQLSMGEINEASLNISRIIKVIDDIAFQTNILALNAAVEAARAGQHGKGFAVVAEEVRNLAARSAEAAKETTELIEGSMSKTKAGTQIANDTAEVLKAILEGVKNAAGLVGEIAEASNEQASAIAEVNNGIEQLSQVVQTNSATSEESAAAAEELSGQADLLRSMVAQFRLKGSSSNLKEKTVAPKRRKEADKVAASVLAEDDFGKY